MVFTEVVNNRLDQTMKVLLRKETEYATTTDRFHNFKVAARKLNCTPERALLGMMIKHVVSIEDIVDSLETDNPKLDVDLIYEKIGDNINYLILLEGMLLQRAEHRQKGMEISK
jgi:hypothetical protein